MSALGWLFFACGGAEPTPGTPPGASASAASVASNGAPMPAGASAPDTSSPTTTLAVGASSSGTKLDPTTAPSPAGSASAPDDGKKKGEPGRTHEDIRVLVIAHRDEARACYDAALAAHPGIEGDVTMKFTIDPEGNVGDIGVDQQRSTIFEPSVGACIGDIIKKIKFAKSAKGFETHGHYPFNFHPRGQQRNRDAG